MCCLNFYLLSYLGHVPVVQDIVDLILEVPIDRLVLITHRVTQEAPAEVVVLVAGPEVEVEVSLDPDPGLLPTKLSQNIKKTADLDQEEKKEVEDLRNHQKGKRIPRRNHVNENSQKNQGKKENSVK